MRLQPVLHALTEQAAQGEILHNDDTSMTVLELLGRAGPRGDPPVDEVSPDRTGVFTSAVVSMGQGRRIALFLTGRRSGRGYGAGVSGRPLGSLRLRPHDHLHTSW
jgi:transposase